MNVYDFCYLCTDDGTTVHIYDMNDNVGEEVFTGTMRDAMWSDYAYREVWSFDFDEQYGLTLNIETESEEE